MTVAKTAEKIHFDLDQIERERVDTEREPFAANIAGRRIVMTDPAEIDWADLMEIDNPILFLKYVITDEDKAHFREQKIPGWKLGKLIEAYQEHYGLGKDRRNAASRI